MDRLGLAALDRLPAHARPAADPRELPTRALHLGLGAFHRAHQAVYTEHAGGWGIAAIAPRSRDVVAALRAQDCLYSVVERSPERPTARVVASITEALHATDDADRVRALLTAPETSVITLTVTEKAHHRRADGKGLDLTAPEIAADLAADLASAAPTTVVGRLTTGLALRHRATGAPVTVVSCDNIADNGAVLAGLVRDYAEAANRPDRDSFLAWLDTAVAFPSTVVDRIVPATTEDDRATAARALGLRDEATVAGEPYRQWVLQDAFTADRPAWERDGALLVPDVRPYQVTKLRLLNGSHSALAYLGAAAGCTTIREVLHTSWGERFVRDFCAEVAPTLPEGGPDPAGYADDLVTRFRNPAVRHLLRQIGSDGSLKVPERWLDPLRALDRAPLLELALAGWVASTRPGDDDRPVHGTTDPLSDELAACWHDRPAHPELVARLLRLVGAPDLAERTDLTTAVAQRLPALRAGRVEF
ncbi:MULTISPECIES: mannitol dehydrogenase family protein [Actinosynnema]|uniref:mannitol dehydrogenase family protein n=1 Tax=Actinosynnema TaxID=40566 RepID=UPI0020A389CA|nr:mannitol dehydrogenase family protein [Actinosynnema pretiosum]